MPGKKKEVVSSSGTESDMENSDSEEEELVNVKQTGAAEFSQADKQQNNQQTTVSSNAVHLYFQKRNARKCLTIVVGIPEDLDLDKISRHFKKMWHCNGNTLNSGKWGEIIQLQGDHRNKIKEFLIQEGIATKDQIHKHGY